MIQKKLHLCWLSGESFPVSVRKSLESRIKILPDFEIRLWTARDARSIGCQYIDQALDCGHWKAATDALRFYVLMKEGGIYMDCDVTVIHRFDRLIPDRGFEAFIDNSGSSPSIHSAVMIGEKDNRFCREIFDYYLNRPYIKLDGSADGATSADVLLRHASANGFRRVNDRQLLDYETIVLPSPFVTTEDEVTDDTFARVGNLDCWHYRQPRRPLPQRVGSFLSDLPYHLTRLFHPIQLPPTK